MCELLKNFCVGRVVLAANKRATTAQQLSNHNTGEAMHIFHLYLNSTNGLKSGIQEDVPHLLMVTRKDRKKKLRETGVAKCGLMFQLNFKADKCSFVLKTSEL